MPRKIDKRRQPCKHCNGLMTKLANKWYCLSCGRSEMWHSADGYQRSTVRIEK